MKKILTLLHSLLFLTLLPSLKTGQPPYNYGAYGPVLIHQQQVGSPPAHFGVFFYNTGINATTFSKTTGLFIPILNNVKSYEDEKKKRKTGNSKLKRAKRSVRIPARTDCVCSIIHKLQYNLQRLIHYAYYQNSTKKPGCIYGEVHHNDWAIFFLKDLILVTEKLCNNLLTESDFHRAPFHMNDKQYWLLNCVKDFFQNNTLMRQGSYYADFCKDWNKEFYYSTYKANLGSYPSEKKTKPRVTTKSTNNTDKGLKELLEKARRKKQSHIKVTVANRTSKFYLTATKFEYKSVEISACFTLAFLTLCPDSSTDREAIERIKKALESVQDEVKHLDDVIKTMLGHELTLAKAITNMEKTFNENIEKINGNMKELKFVLKKHAQLIVQNMYRQAAAEIMKGNFPTTLIGNGAEVNKFRESFCKGKYPALCDSNSEFPFGSKILSFGSFNGELWLSAYYSYIDTNEVAFDISYLPVKYGKQCLRIENKYDQVVITNKDDSKSLTFFKNGQVAFMEKSGQGSSYKFEKCLTILIEQCLCSQYFNKFMEVNKKNPLKLSKCNSPIFGDDIHNYCYSNAEGNSMLSYMGKNCFATEVAPGLKFDPDKSSLIYLGSQLVVFNHFSPFPPDWDPPVPKYSNATNGIDPAEWARESKRIIDDMTRREKAAEDAIDRVKASEAKFSWVFGILGTLMTVVLFILIAYCICQCACKGGKIGVLLIALAAIALADPVESFSVEPVVKKVFKVICSDTGCPKPGNYRITVRGGQLFISEALFKCLASDTAINMEIAQATGIALSLFTLVLFIAYYLWINCYRRKKVKLEYIDQSGIEHETLVKVSTKDLHKTPKLLKGGDGNLNFLKVGETKIPLKKAARVTTFHGSVIDEV